MRRAYSYIRFSTPEQLKGDSLRRQLALTADYCKRNNLALDESLNLRDLGVSAFRGSNAATGALASFLQTVQLGRVPSGAVLIVENLDRLTRDEVGKALSLFISILDAGIHIVTLRPEVEYTKKSINDISVILQAVLQLFLGHEESSKKSGRLTEVWDAKRSAIARRKLTGKAPFWLHLTEDGQNFAVIEEKVALVKRIFGLARDGHGGGAIARKLNADGIPSPYGRPWNNVSVLWVLRNRAVIGEFTPHRGRMGERQPTGEPIGEYYPVILSEAEFYAVQAAITARKHQRGPRGKRVANLFTGLLRDARDGSPMHLIEKQKGNVRMVSSSAMRGADGAEYVSFSYPVFEEAILKLLREVDPSEVLNGGNGADEIMTLSGKLARIEAGIAAIESEMDANGESQVLFKRLRAKEAEKQELAKRLEAAREKAAHPLSEAWGEARSLFDVAQNDEGRLRLRSILARLVQSIELLIVRRPWARLAAVQIWFADGKHHRDYLIYHRAAHGNGSGRTEGGWQAWSLAEVVRHKRKTLDLRRSEDAEALEQVLSEMDLAAFATEDRRF